MTTKALRDGSRLIDFIKANGWVVLPLQLVVLRDADSDSWQPLQPGLDSWDDAIVLLKGDGTVMFSVRGTSTAGAHYSKNPMNPKGCARLAIGQHLECWERGLHHQQQAFRQRKPLRIHRDSNRDLQWLETPQFDNADSFINVHTTGNNASSPPPATIGRWSAGCIVLRAASVHYNQLLPEFAQSGLRYLTVDVVDSKVYQQWRQKWG